MFFKVEAAMPSSLADFGRFEVVKHCVDFNNSSVISNHFTYEEALEEIISSYGEDDLCVDFYKYWAEQNDDLNKLLELKDPLFRQNFIYEILRQGKPSDEMITELLGDEEGFRSLFKKKQLQRSLQDNISYALESDSLDGVLRFDGVNLCTKSGVSVTDMLEKLYQELDRSAVLEKVLKSNPFDGTDVEDLFMFLRKLFDPEP